jgi:hypothetical protein
MNTEEIKYQRAKKIVAALRGFYIHLGVYIFVNLFLFLLDILTSPTGLWFYWPLLGWTMAVLLHGFSVFGGGRMLGDDWEARKIAEILEE